MNISGTNELLELGCLREENRAITAWEDFIQPILERDRTDETRLSDVVQEVYGVELSNLEKAGLDLMLPHLIWRIWRLWDMAAEGEVVAGGENWQQRIVPVLYDKLGGIGKSTPITALLEDAGTWSETITSDELDSKVFVEKTKKSLIVNFDDFEDLRGRDFSRVKRFVTEEKNTVRLSYRMDADTYPRVGILMASTNKKRVLADEENTRFLYVDLDAANPDTNGGVVRSYLNQPGLRDGLVQTAWEDCQKTGWRPYLPDELVEQLRRESQEHTYMIDEGEQGLIQEIMNELCMAEGDGDLQPSVGANGAIVPIFKPGVEGYGIHMLQKDKIPNLPYVLMSDFSQSIFGGVQKGGAGSRLLDTLDKLGYIYTPNNKVYVDVGGKKAWRRYRCLYLG